MYKLISKNFGIIGNNAKMHIYNYCIKINLFVTRILTIIIIITSIKTTWNQATLILETYNLMTIYVYCTCRRNLIMCVIFLQRIWQIIMTSCIFINIYVLQKKKIDFFCKLKEKQEKLFKNINIQIINLVYIYQYVCSKWMIFTTSKYEKRAKNALQS